MGLFKCKKCEQTNKNMEEYINLLDRLQKENKELKEKMQNLILEKKQREEMPEEQTQVMDELIENLMTGMETLRKDFEKALQDIEELKKGESKPIESEIGYPNENESKSVKDRIVDFLEGKEPQTNRSVADTLKITDSHCYNTLRMLIIQGKVKKTKDGNYRLP